ncbi:Protein of unknown function [Pyronema omphalodes CBS 100304]|uniref:Uncharacterized protein n=1 Tax=Pyronema omphalodes (strain CBS 100304) TaxID=1076935 RepID=U4LTR2_PYROM|nr:Protein of unknown function [Pyronema omphalodes CBS 100304]
MKSTCLMKWTSIHDGVLLFDDEVEYGREVRDWDWDLGYNREGYWDIEIGD